MIEIKSMSDVERVPEQYRETIRKFQKALEEDTQFDWERHGYMIFLEEDDDLNNVPYLPFVFEDTGYADSVSCFLKEGLYELICVLNNEFVVTYWLSTKMFLDKVLPVNGSCYVEVCLDTTRRLPD